MYVPIISPAVTRLSKMFASVEESILEKPPKGEIAWQSTSFFGTVPYEPWNPDELVAQKGARIYKEMRRDDQIKAALAFVLDTIVSRQWRFAVPAGDSPDAETQAKIADFFTWNLNNVLRGSWTDAMRQVLDAKATGYSVNEMVFASSDYDGASRWCLRALKLRPYETFRFRIDEFGNIVDLYQLRAAEREILDPRKFIIFRANQEMDSTFGESDLRACYRWYWYKQTIAKQWAMYLEQAAGGLVVAKVATALQNNNLETALKNRSGQTSLTVPDGVDIEVHYPASTDAYERAIDHYNLSICRALLMPALLGLGPQQKFGSNAQSSTHGDFFLLAMQRQGDSLADALNEQLFKPLAMWNFGTETFPLFTFDPFTADQKQQVVNAWGIAVKRGIVHQYEGDENKVRNLLGFDPLPDGVDYPDPFET